MLEERKEENWVCVYEKYSGWDGMVAFCILFFPFPFILAKVYYQLQVS